jgi:hypothetical protein
MLPLRLSVIRIPYHQGVASTQSCATCMHAAAATRQVRSPRANSPVRAARTGRLGCGRPRSAAPRTPCAAPCRCRRSGGHNTTWSPPRRMGASWSGAVRRLAPAAAGRGTRPAGAAISSLASFPAAADHGRKCSGGRTMEPTPHPAAPALRLRLRLRRRSVSNRTRSARVQCGQTKPRGGAMRAPAVWNLGRIQSTCIHRNISIYESCTKTDPGSVATSRVNF